MTKNNTENTSVYQNAIDAFWILLEQRPYEQITVNTLLNVAGISRTAFYYHFTNLRQLSLTALHNEFKDRDLLNLIRVSVGVEDAQVAANPPTGDLLERHAMHVSLALGPHGSREFISYVYDLYMKILRDILGLKGPFKNKKTQIICEFMAGGLISLLGQQPEHNIVWNNRHDGDQTSQLVDVLTQIYQYLTVAKRNDASDD